jgi:hypothetical protein
MKLLICSDCPDPLTTVAQGLNRMRSEQIRLEPSFRPQAPLGKPEIPSPVDHELTSSLDSSRLR